MTAKGRQWAERDLRVTEVRERPGFQLRAGGLDRSHVNRLRLLLDDGEDLPAVKVAQVGEALYLVDGFHRLEAHRRAGLESVRAAVARMSLPEAQEEARLANTRHGKGLSRADKEKLWADFVAADGHRDAFGALKSPRALSAELNRVISHTTIRSKLKAMGLEGELEPVKPWRDEQVDAELLAAERKEEAETFLRLFGELVPTLHVDDREALLEAARALLDSLGRGEMPEALRAVQPVHVGELPDI
jgi:hypothetical protein